MYKVVERRRGVSLCGGGRDRSFKDIDFAVLHYRMLAGTRNGKRLWQHKNRCDDQGVLETICFRPSLQQRWIYPPIQALPLMQTIHKQTCANWMCSLSPLIVDWLHSTPPVKVSLEKSVKWLKCMLKSDIVFIFHSVFYLLFSLHT